MRTNRGRNRGNIVNSVHSLGSSLEGGVNGDNNTINTHHHRGEKDDSNNEIHNEGVDDDDDVSVLTATNYNGNEKEGNDVGVLGHQSKFLTASMMLRLFSVDVKHPEEGMRVIYVDGAWDMFHCGHIELLEEASKISFIFYCEVYILSILTDWLVGMQSKECTLFHIHLSPPRCVLY